MLTTAAVGHKHSRSQVQSAFLVTLKGMITATCQTPFSLKLVARSDSLVHVETDAYVNIQSWKGVLTELQLLRRFDP
jgi:hypothetical protein